jgi:hypothetical protein
MRACSAGNSSCQTAPKSASIVRNGLSTHIVAVDLAARRAWLGDIRRPFGPKIRPFRSADAWARARRRAGVPARPSRRAPCPRRARQYRKVLARIRDALVQGRLRRRRALIKCRRSSSFRRPPRKRPRSVAARRRSRDASESKCSPSAVSTGCRIAASACWSQGRRALARAALAPRFWLHCRIMVSVWWLVPRLDKADRQGDEYNRLRKTESLLGQVVPGRDALDPRAHPAGAMCPRHLVVNRAAGGACTSTKSSARTAAPCDSRADFSARRRRCATTRSACSS